MKKIITTGSIGVDYVFLVDKLPNKGQSIISKKFEVFCGGKGANQAVSLGKLGASVKMIGHVGNDENGNISIKNLMDNSIDTKYVKKVSNYTTQIANIVVDDNGDNLLIVDVGANFSFTREEVEDYKHLIDEADIVLTQLETSIEFIEEFLKYAKEKNKIVILNPGPAKLISKDLIQCCDFITPNETELCILLNKEYTEDFETLKKYAFELQDISQKNVIVTLGINGSMWINEKKEFKKYEAYKIKAVDATAAGDTFMGGFTTYLAMNKNIDECIRYATAASALAVTKLGAQSSIPSKKEVEEFIKKNN
ncbi:ribokinase [Spiroplasma tabanidicola]|uniref:Ribokinase n=1 Tax=Spiroplasma tabanidicola TaxID=324079 RepID=A0A6I6CCC9_9MOLU|nr:ribokinase [Spiroplasma tabanidicola]QGS51624.1 ribokinase [Spiroplasma tabanidicola]